MGTGFYKGELSLSLTVMNAKPEIDIGLFTDIFQKVQ